MKRDASGLLLSATELGTFTACRRRVLLDREALFGHLKPPPLRNDPAIRLLQERGDQHETRYKHTLEAKHGEPVFRIPVGVLQTAAEWQAGTQQTLAAMQAGQRVIYQAPLSLDGWYGRADFLERVDHTAGEAPTRLGSYHYRVIDTKLAQEVRGSALLQLCVYTEIVAQLQGHLPEHMLVVSPSGTPEAGKAAEPELAAFPTADYLAYFRRIRRRMEEFATKASLDDVYPEPCEHCDVCSWWTSCEARRRADDHLSFVAGLTRRDQRLLEGAEVKTLEELARVRLPMATRPRKLREETLERLHHQARLQLEARETKPTYELTPAVEEGKGFARLPEPDEGDIFFDIEADRYAVDGTFHYLLGWVERSADGKPAVFKLWAQNRAEERKNFETFVKHVQKRRDTYPKLHVFHFAPFEKTALGELSGRYASCEDDVDQLLREQVLCDLLPVVKQGLRAGVESYSLKELERFYGFERQVDLREAASARRLFELGRETGGADGLASVVATIEGYNREDCESTLHLRDWLETLRDRHIAEGRAVPRPTIEKQELKEEQSEWLARVEALRRRLLVGVADEPTQRTEGQMARQLLADVLDWHRRKEKPTWWEYFRVRGLTAEECFEESGPIGNLGPEKAAGKEKKSQLFEYAFPSQDYKIKLGDKVECPVTKQVVGEVHELRRDQNVLVVKRTKQLELAPVALMTSPNTPGDKALRNALAEVADKLASERFGLPEEVSDWGAPDVSFPAARALLSRDMPTLTPGVRLQQPSESAADAAIRIAPHLRDTVLAIQGPPGAGKSYTASRMILALLEQGKRVGITANSHKVIGNLLAKVQEAAQERNVTVRSVQKADEDQWFSHEHNLRVDKNAAARDAAAEMKALNGKGCLLAGTQYFWSSPEMRGTVDVLLIDEAGQFSLANALAVTVAAKSLVLLGDPQQLSSPDQGTHPPGAGASALEHMLHGKATIPEGLGLFLHETRRLPPAVAKFTSEYFYSGRLRAHDSCAKRALRPSSSAARFAGSGIFFVRKEHEGNVSHCPEEADEIVALTQDLLEGASTWVDGKGAEHALEQKNILVVAPYNAQVQLVSEALRKGGFEHVSVGTVDKFQGQEAPVVIYSMTTSSPEDAPRGFEFLYQLERLNVATSRAQAIVIVVASPRLLEAECKTPSQMRLVNGLCGAAEMANA